MRKITPKTEDTMEAGMIPGRPMKSKKEPIKIYPRVRLEHQFFPETKDWKVGKTYKVEMMLKMTGLSIAKFQNDSEFDIVGFEGEEEKGEEPESD